jgi:hypothetical protein
MNTLSQQSAPTFESVWASLQETARVLNEKIVEVDRQREETERILYEKCAEFDRILNKIAAEEEQRSKSIEDDKKAVWASLRETSKLVGGMANSNGDVAESYFVNSFAKHLYFAGQEFDSYSANLVKGVKKLNLNDQYDLVLYNSASVVIIEIKYKAKKEDIEQVLKKAQTFKQLFPEYSNHNLYLGLAGLNVAIDAEKEAVNQGIAIIKQLGDNMVIHDEHLKAF